MEDRWLSVDEIVEYLGVSRDTVYAWIAERGLPAHRVGRFWKFKKAAVDGWVQSGGAAMGDGVDFRTRHRSGRASRGR
jgi:excisionase family DNA binding protein